MAAFPGSIFETDILFEDSILKNKKGYFVEVSNYILCMEH